MFRKIIMISVLDILILTLPRIFQQNIKYEYIGLGLRKGIQT